MSRIACSLHYHTNGTHIQQLYTGLFELHRAGLIELSQQMVPVRIPERAAQHLRDAWRTHAKVVLNRHTTLHFDMHDACEIDLVDLEMCDFYFKRSYSRAYVERLPDGGDKVLPFGFNYHVLPDAADWFALSRALHLPASPGDRVSSIREALDAGNLTQFHSRLRELQAPPDYAADARVLFLVAAYDPHDIADRTPEKVHERKHINEMRAQCIRLLRKELGSRFLGGFSHSAYTVAHYKDCLVSNARITDKKVYLRTRRSFPICVATTGLHGSNGWKLAEYVACAKAIASERLVYEVPGPFEADRNYLEFTSPERCVEQVSRLISDPALRHEMMTANALYYGAYQRPDAIVLNALMSALSLRWRYGSRRATDRSLPIRQPALTPVA
jgi:hypothetical protein